jgi:hypothetical protein
MPSWPRSDPSSRRDRQPEKPLTASAILRPMTGPATRSPVGDAFAWASRIIAVGMVMFLPAVLGTWIDGRLATRFVGPTGLVLGFVTGLAWLVRISRPQSRP